MPAGALAGTAWRWALAPKRIASPKQKSRMPPSKAPKAAKVPSHKNNNGSSVELAVHAGEVKKTI